MPIAGFVGLGFFAYRGSKESDAITWSAIASNVEGTVRLKPFMVEMAPCHVSTLGNHSIVRLSLFALAGARKTIIHTLRCRNTVKGQILERLSESLGGF
jgi:hypothetical protein